MVTLLSPAKVNLFLKIVGRRPDGYHNLASLFQTISLVDVLHFSPSDQDKLTCTDPSLPTDNSNLVLKAVDLFRRKTGRSFGVRIHLEKNIPCQAGLGGGSSNAATTLWALNMLNGQPATTEELSRWSSEIGSDIPFFFSNGTAYCTGRGEVVRNLNPIIAKPTNPIWIVKPADGLSTPAVYRNVILEKLSQYNPEIALKSFYSNDPQYFNDLEQPAFTVMPTLAELKQHLLESGFHNVMMTGSGSGFFCIGQGNLPKDANLFCKQVNFLNRQANNWYNDHYEK